MPARGAQCVSPGESHLATTFSFLQCVWPGAEQAVSERPQEELRPGGQGSVQRPAGGPAVPGGAEAAVRPGAQAGVQVGHLVTGTWYLTVIRIHAI